MGSTYTCLHYHIVFSTKHRAQLITPEVTERLYSYIGAIIGKRDGTLHAGGGTPDHLHLLVSLHQSTPISELLRLIKANSSKWIHETFPRCRSFAWQDGYAAFTVSHSNIEAVREYIAKQAEHHRTMTFQDEFRAMLKRHGVAYDERYIWD